MQKLNYPMNILNPELVTPEQSTNQFWSPLRRTDEANESCSRIDQVSIDIILIFNSNGK